MRPGGWIFLLFAWGIILSITVFCFMKIFAKKELT